MKESFILENGMTVPTIGFGTYNAKGGDNLQMIKDAIEVGYRYFDTASLYGTERALGQAIKEAVGDKKGIRRYGYFILPMDESLALCAVDLCGRPYLQFDCNFTTEKVGDLETELIREFFYAISYSAGMNLHLRMLASGNNHHMAEAMFKAFGRALDEATTVDPRIIGQLSSKGTLA